MANTSRERLICIFIFCSIVFLGLYPFSISAELVNLQYLTNVQKTLLKEHVYGGLPSQQNIYIRIGYVLCFNPSTKTPK